MAPQTCPEVTNTFPAPHRCQEGCRKPESPPGLQEIEGTEANLLVLFSSPCALGVPLSWRRDSLPEFRSSLCQEISGWGGTIRPEPVPCPSAGSCGRGRPPPAAPAHVQARGLRLQPRAGNRAWGLEEEPRLSLLRDVRGAPGGPGGGGSQLRLYLMFTRHPLLWCGHEIGPAWHRGRKV